MQSKFKIDLTYVMVLNLIVSTYVNDAKMCTKGFLINNAILSKSHYQFGYNGRKFTLIARISDNILIIEQR